MLDFQFDALHHKLMRTDKPVVGKANGTWFIKHVPPNATSAQYGQAHAITKANRKADWMADISLATSAMWRILFEDKP